jgi:hypothetical protein
MIIRLWHEYLRKSCFEYKRIIWLESSGDVLVTFLPAVSITRSACYVMARRYHPKITSTDYTWIPKGYIWRILTMVHYIPVSCLFGHYPSSNSVKSQRFRDWLCLRLQVIKERARGRWSYLVGPLDRANLHHWRLALSPSSGDKGKGKREVILSGGSLRQS